MIWLGVVFVASIGAAMIIWRDAAAAMLQMSLGARSHPGCAVGGGLLLVALALSFAALYATGIIPLR